jgi:hypothetical protein
MRTILSAERQSIPTMHEHDTRDTVLHVDMDGCYPYEVLVVLVEGGANDYAAYYGLVPTMRHDDDHLNQWVAAHGHKLSFEKAKGYFPIGLVAEKYRA